ncbi:hypothetical protein C6W96_04290 [Streptomyces sp. CS149]|nr:hypothetical protein C6W96_04290 [Streptomyces sp. CS149]
MFTASSLCISKGTASQRDAGDGVSTYLALTFGTLLSSQGTDASFGPVSPGPSGRFPSFFFFVLLSCVSDSIRLFRVRFPVEAGFTFASR